MDQLQHIIALFEATVMRLLKMLKASSLLPHKIYTVSIQQMLLSLSLWLQFTCNLYLKLLHLVFSSVTLAPLDTRFATDMQEKQAVLHTATKKSLHCQQVLLLLLTLAAVCWNDHVWKPGPLEASCNFSAVMATKTVYLQLREELHTQQDLRKLFGWGFFWLVGIFYFYFLFHLYLSLTLLLRKTLPVIILSRTHKTWYMIH